MWGNLVGSGRGGRGGDKVGERKNMLKKSLLLGGQLEEALSRGGVEEERWGGEMREGFREEESGLRT